MSYHQFEVPPLKRIQIRRVAYLLRDLVKAGPADPVDVIHLLENVLPEVFPGFMYDYLSDEEMGDMEGATIPDEALVRIRQSVYDGARRGVGRDRLTVVHEIAHFLLHKGVKLQAARVKSGQSIPKFRCSEWQADCLAGETLITPAGLLKAGSVSAAARYLKVSPKAALFHVGVFQKEGLLAQGFPTW